MNKQPDVTLFWDFYGSTAEGTARHFQRHLCEFLNHNSISGEEPTISSADARVWSVSWSGPPQQALNVGNALQPQRYIGELSHD